MMFPRRPVGPIAPANHGGVIVMNIRSGSRFAALLALLALALGLAACGAPAVTTPLRAVRAERAPAAPTSAQAVPASAAAPASGPVLGTLDIHSVDLGFQPN